MSEFELIAALHQRLGAIGADRIELGIGDDAALWAVPAGHTLVACCDTLIEGRHFPAGTEPGDIGWKALAVNLSDLAAMGATPRAALLALSLPALPESRWIEGFCEGWATLARPYDVALAGGDTTRGQLIALTVTVFGEVPDGIALRRDGARPGDGIFVSGCLGDAAAALARWRQRGVASGDALDARLARPVPRIALGQALRGLAASAIDISDGFAADLCHVLRASGVGAEVEIERLPLSGELQATVPLQEAVDLALRGGDDYELCFTVPAVREGELCAIAARTGVAISRVGTVRPGTGLRVIDRDGHARAMTATGWDHFE